ncbi:MAG: hypothetical protein ACXACU_15845 [Candidatus Hodarchaeales archaeon]|jgi:hypothetical protein
MIDQIKGCLLGYKDYLVWEWYNSSIIHSFISFLVTFAALLIIITFLSGCTLMVCGPVTVLRPEQLGECVKEMGELDGKIIKKAMSNKEDKSPQPEKEIE